MTLLLDLRCVRFYCRPRVFAAVACCFATFLVAQSQEAGCPVGSTGAGCCYSVGEWDAADAWCSENYSSGFKCVNNHCGEDDCCAHPSEAINSMMYSFAAKTALENNLKQGGKQACIDAAALVKERSLFGGCNGDTGCGVDFSGCFLELVEPSPTNTAIAEATNTGAIDTTTSNEPSLAHGGSGASVEATSFPPAEASLTTALAGRFLCTLCGITSMLLWAGV